MSLTRLNTSDVNVATRLVNRPQDGRQVHRRQIGWVLLGQIAWVGLALFVTAGFAVALSLFTGRSAMDPGPLHACAFFFVWCVMSLGSTCNA
jgi:hypothetical protein